MDKYTKTNLDRWNELTQFNFESRFYDVKEFVEGRNSLGKLDKEKLGDINGKRILHLQCHFGMDSISMVRFGASVVGIDFSHEAIKKANKLKKDLNHADDQLRFVECNVLNLDLLSDRELEPESFDIVYTSHGVLSWLSNLKPWGESIFRYLKSGGFFLVIDMHPFAYTYDENFTKGIKLQFSYFHTGKPNFSDEPSAYSDLDGDSNLKNKREYYWAHNLGYIIESLTKPGLIIENLNEFPFISWKFLPFLERREDRYFHFPDSYSGPIAPLMFSLKARKPNND